VCLTEETTETLYALGAGELVVGVSGFTVRPPEARKKPKVSTFLDANIERILALQPDVVLAWSDLQANICAELIRNGVEVICFNHRTVEGILSMIVRLGALVGRLLGHGRTCAPCVRDCAELRSVGGNGAAVHGSTSRSGTTP